ncbi:MAG: hypothetical protein HOP30_18965 [Cyclobacteriaceae bacterium]|nr:hypothetical protein [Cyclobacteriaceae bacterium]
MNKNLQKHLLSIAVIVTFFFIASSSTVNKIHTGAFNYYNSVEEKDAKNHIVLNDGEQVYGDRIDWKTGLFVKDQIKVDNHKFAIKDVRGYLENGVYYGRLKDEYIQRIVHGPKINVYVRIVEVVSQTPGTKFTTRSKQAYHYAQKGEDGPMIAFGSQKKIRELVAGCPEAVKMATKSGREMRRAIRKNRNYLNSIFDTYNKCN